jgi:hypothetical protein
MTDTLYCTIDTLRVREEDKIKGQAGAVRMAIAAEIRIGRTLELALRCGSRNLVKVDNANRTAILDEERKVLPGGCRNPRKGK